MKRRKSEKTFYWRWCWVWQLPGSKNKLLMAGRQDADVGTCQGQTAQVAAALVERAWRPQGVRTSMTGNGLRFSAGSLLKQDSRASPPVWAGSQSTQKRRWCFPLNHPRLSPGAGREEHIREHWEQPRDAWWGWAEKTIPWLRRGSSEEGRAGWRSFLLGGLTSPSDCLTPERGLSVFKKPGFRVQWASGRRRVNLGRTTFRMIRMKNRREGTLLNC